MLGTPVGMLPCVLHMPVPGMCDAIQWIAACDILHTPAFPFMPSLFCLWSRCSFYEVAGSSPVWKHVAKPLGCSRAEFARVEHPDLDTAKRLSFYLAAGAQLIHILAS